MWKKRHKRTDGLRWLLLCGVMGLCGMGSCVASQETKRFQLQEGPTMGIGRMSASLGVVRLADGRVVVVGGSPSEDPFLPIKGKQAVEILEPKTGVWAFADIDVPYQISGRVFVLPDGRLFAFASVYVFNPDASDTEPGADKADAAGAVSAVILDLEKKTATPLFRPQKNIAGQPPLKGSGPALVQRAFAQSIRLKDGRIVRVGGAVRYSYPDPEARCEASRCRYCYDGTCAPFSSSQDHFCREVKDCPYVKGQRKIKQLSVVEVYTPPDAAHPLGQVRVLSLPEGRQDLGLVELPDGRLLVVGGQGEEGLGTNKVYDSTLFLDIQTGLFAEGPRMRVGREDLSIALLDNGEVLLTGGTDAEGKTLNVTEILNPLTGTIRDGEPMSEPREDHIPIRIGGWLVFFGGEDNAKEDQVLNSAEIFDVKEGSYLGSFLLFRRSDVLDDELCPNTKGYAGIDDFGVVSLDDNRVLLVGGQQGCQDPDGAYISAGKGNKRTLLIILGERK